MADYLLTLLTSSRGVRVPFLEQDSSSFSDQDLINLRLAIHPAAPLLDTGEFS